MTPSRKAAKPLLVALAVGLSVVLGSLAFATLQARKGRGARAASPEGVLRIPQSSDAVTLDGELGERAWLRDAMRTGGFVDARGARAIPFSEAHVVWREDSLMLALYAADVDIRTRPPAAGDTPADAFVVELDAGGRSFAFEVTPSGEVRARPCKVPARCPTDAAWAKGLMVGKDVDGTLDDATDHDEEWVLEIAIPLQSIGLASRAGERFDVRISRCDTPPGAAESCAQWPSSSAPAALVLGGS